jgi:uncharacterized protein YdeI (BOF family)
MKRSLVAIAAALLISAAVFAQQLEVKQQVAGWTSMAAPQQAGFMAKVVKNAPYSAKQVHEHTQTLADGTHISTTTTTTIYRDSSGRTRTEVNDEIVTIVDPIVGATYRLNTKAQTVSTIRQITINPVMELSNPELLNKIAGSLEAQATFSTTTPTGNVTVTYDRGGGPLPLPNNGEFTRESLGTQSMEGLVVEGTRLTHTIQAGEIGNDRPINSVTEQWYSPELQLYVLTKTSDPRNGESVTRLTEVNRADPDSSLFQVPANYRLLSGVGPIGTGRGGGRGN